MGHFIHFFRLLSFIFVNVFVCFSFHCVDQNEEDKLEQCEKETEKDQLKAATYE